MPYLRRRGISTLRRGPKARYTWVREDLGSVTPTFPSGPNSNFFDLLKQWRIDNNLTLQLPDLTIWRIHIQISIRFRFTTSTLQNSAGAHIACFVDDQVEVPQLTTFSMLAQRYAKHPLIWEQLFWSEQAVQGGFDLAINTTTDNFLYKRYDVKSHRRLQAQEDTLWLAVVATGNIAMQELAYQQSTLVRLPR